MPNPDPVDFAKLIPELTAWNNGSGISIEAWTGCVGNIELAIGYSQLFWPDFIEHDGCVLFADFSPQSYQAFLEQCEGDRRRVETVMNHRHVFDYFCDLSQSATHDQLIYIGRMLKEMWRAKLNLDFPARAFVFSFPEGPFEDVIDYEVTFWQKLP